MGDMMIDEIKFNRLMEMNKQTIFTKEDLFFI